MTTLPSKATRTEHHTRFTALFLGPHWLASARRELLDLGRLTEADTRTLTICLGATPSRQTTAHLQHPPIFFTGRMPFLPPNQQHQSTEGTQSAQNSILLLIFCG